MKALWSTCGKFIGLRRYVTDSTSIGAGSYAVTRVTQTPYVCAGAHPCVRVRLRVCVRDPCVTA